jgi:hypothetical protein
LDGPLKVYVFFVDQRYTKEIRDPKRIKEIKGYNCSKTTTEQGFSPAGY